MKNIVMSIVCILTILACNSNDTLEPIDNSVISDNTGDIEISEDPDISEETNDSTNNDTIVNVSYLKYAVKNKDHPDDIYYTQEYIFDAQGKVLSEQFTNFSNPQYSHFSTFEYNDQGRVIEEIREDLTFMHVVWTNDFAEVYNKANTKVDEFYFDGEHLTQYKTGFYNNTIRTKILNYDADQNIVAIGNESGIYVEYLEYDISKINPLYLIKSIGILRIDYKPFFKNIFGVEQVYSYAGSDYNQPMSFYNYYYEFDTENRVYQIEDELTLIYTKEFYYEE